MLDTVCKNNQINKEIKKKYVLLTCDWDSRDVFGGWSQRSQRQVFWIVCAKHYLRFFFSHCCNVLDVTCHPGLQQDGQGGPAVPWEHENKCKISNNKAKKKREKKRHRIPLLIHLLTTGRQKNSRKRSWQLSYLTATWKNKYFAFFAFGPSTLLKSFHPV